MEHTPGDLQCVRPQTPLFTLLSGLLLVPYTS